MGKKIKTGKGRLDKYYHLAKEQGYRARSAFKLIQLTQRNDIFSRCRCLLDLCAAPGGWLQVAQKNMPVASTIVGVDLAPIKPIRGVVTIQADITTQRCRNLLKKEVPEHGCDVVLHDGAPNVGTSWVHDAYSQNELVLHATKLCCEFLKTNGTYITKVFRSQDYTSLLWVFQQLFNHVIATKPSSSRDVSAEIFVICSGYKNPVKIDPKFFNPRHVFVNHTEGSSNRDHAPLTEGKSKLGLKELVQAMNKKNRQGYNEGDDYRTATINDFFSDKTQNPAEFLVSHHKLTFPNSDPITSKIKEHPATTEDILLMCNDLKVLGKREFSILIKWRFRIKRQWLKEQQMGSLNTQEEEVSNKLTDDGESDTEPTINEDEASLSVNEDDIEDQEKEWQKELLELRDEEKKALLKERRKKREELKKRNLQRERSLGAFDVVEVDDELFQRSMAEEVFPDEDEILEKSGLLKQEAADAAYLDDDSNESQEETESEKSSDDEYQDEEARRLSRMAVDLETLAEMEKEQMKTSVLKRELKKKKETRRQQVYAAWGEELRSAANEMQRKAEAAAIKHIQTEDNEDEDSSDNLPEDDVPESKYFQIKEENETEILQGNHTEEQRAIGAIGGKQDAEMREGSDDDVGSLEAQQSRWFEQPLFKEIGIDLTNLKNNEDEAAAVLTSLPQMPLTDKEILREKRKRAREKQEKKEENKKTRRFGPLGIVVDDHDSKGFTEVPATSSVLLHENGTPGSDNDGDTDEEAIQQVSYTQQPETPEKLAELQTLGSLLLRKRTRMDLVDGAYNRYAFNDDEAVPEWFIEEEDEYAHPELPVTKDMMREYKKKLKEISRRPIRKVQEAKGRKQMRLKKSLEKVRKQCESIAASPDHTEASKTQSINKLMRKARRGGDLKEKSYIVSKKQGGGVAVGGKKGGRTTVVDRRLKKDKRAQRVAARHQKKRR